MCSYIASLLGFQQQIATTSMDQNHATSGKSSTSTFSCQGYGWTIPDSTIRLSIANDSDHTIRIFGFPPQTDYSEAMWYPKPHFGFHGPYAHYLLVQGPAYVKYITGDNWRSQLVDDHETRRWRTCAVMLRPPHAANNTRCTLELPLNSAAEAEERAHSLRMRRCGAVAMATQDDIGDWNDLSEQMIPKYFFDWPDDGGVWALQSPWTTSEAPNEAQLHGDERDIMQDNLRKGERDEAYRKVVNTLKR